MNEKLTEEYWRVDFDTAKLLKEAGFDCEVSAIYKFDYLFFRGFLSNSSTKGYISAPLISVAIEWLKELKYNYMAVMNSSKYVLWLKSEPLGSKYTFEASPFLDREFNLAFIQACCKHRIEQLKLYTS